MIKPIGICEQALDVVELMTAEVNAVQFPTLCPHAANCRPSDTLHNDRRIKRSEQTEGAVRAFCLKNLQM